MTAGEKRGRGWLCGLSIIVTLTCLVVLLASCETARAPSSTAASFGKFLNEGFGIQTLDKKRFDVLRWAWRPHRTCLFGEQMTGRTQELVISVVGLFNDVFDSGIELSYGNTVEACEGMYKSYIFVHNGAFDVDDARRITTTIFHMNNVFPLEGEGVHVNELGEYQLIIDRNRKKLAQLTHISQLEHVDITPNVKSGMQKNIILQELYHTFTWGKDIGGRVSKARSVLDEHDLSKIKELPKKARKQSLYEYYLDHSVDAYCHYDIMALLAIKEVMKFDKNKPFKESVNYMIRPVKKLVDYGVKHYERLRAEATTILGNPTYKELVGTNCPNLADL